ncbi:hypothetical protein HHI36_020671 [Cryptolaemus montrouzieri]|uniref:Gustatory receptor n=1 Tax=Cryptolaemus montrouzieri TaxID=559131 RepID=A0ABD2NBR2_9CUCU
MSVNALNYQTIFPMKPILGSPNQQDVFIFLTYTSCEGEHKANPALMKLSNAETIEYFRLLHGELCKFICNVNECFNPQLLIHTTVEILMLVINWYAVIIGIAYNFNNPESAAILILNSVFAAVHTVGLFLFLRNAQQLTNTLQAYTAFLIDYSIRVTSPSEFLQLRIFIEKVREYNPFTANGMFVIDLGVAGPIFTNILTYVLVALQFDITV